MLRKTYDKVMALGASRRAVPALFGISFAESSFFPIPPDLLLIPMVLANRVRWIFYATVCTVASVLGGMLGYAIGALLFQQVAMPILELYGYAGRFDEFISWFNASGAWVVFLAGITPFPYKVITIASGAAGLSMPVFLVASLLSRGIRFFVVAALLYWFGPPIRTFVEKRLALVFTVFGILAVLGILAVKLL
ncbi:YqaA family protein [Acuticoccus sp. MNP-M23]|uniref:YqaA family protein n=1 Tax=Acuticoccus sp. MNP-M23 TaxID=3072793 RepID=UPI002816635B|nr:YqaA family protein [Acuticoccus sp. MNP-M23]WMS42913.1 YqaA family protein [Acuticoccus sp. MNP-M23]